MEQKRFTEQTWAESQAKKNVSELWWNIFMSWRSAVVSTWNVLCGFINCWVGPQWWSHFRKTETLGDGVRLEGVESLQANFWYLVLLSSVCLSVYHLSVHLTIIYVSMYLFIIYIIYPSTYLSIHPPIYLSQIPSPCLSWRKCLSTGHHHDVLRHWVLDITRLMSSVTLTQDFIYFLHRASSAPHKCGQHQHQYQSLNGKRKCGM